LERQDSSSHFDFWFVTRLLFYNYLNLFVIGLDDYPRSSPPHSGEIHVDLISWVGLMTKSLKSIALELGKDSDVAKFEKHFKRIQKSLDGNLLFNCLNFSIFP
jgi:hypothetical protein